MSRRVLVGVVDWGSSKEYAVPKLLENLDACVDGVDGVEIEWWGTYRGYPTHELGEIGGRGFSEDVLRAGRELIRRRVLEGGFTHCLWQGLDCYWPGRDDFERFLETATAPGIGICGAITVGRARRDYPVVRRWVERDGRLTTEQTDVPLSELHMAYSRGGMVPCGFPGTEANTVSAEVLELLPVDNPKHANWYDRAEVETKLCVEEFFCWQAAKLGHVVVCDPDVRMWHANDDGWAGRWLEDDRRLEDLSW